MEKKEGDRKDGDLIKKKERFGFGSFILLTETDDEEGLSKPTMLILWSDSLSSPDDDQKKTLKFKSLGFPLPNFCYDYCIIDQSIIIGSCNGLVCLYVHRLKQISLWNPSTGDVNTLPKSIPFAEENDCLHRLVSFGVDLETKDFKVMILDGLQRDYYRPWAPPIDCPCRVQVYSLRSNSWRLLDYVDSLPGDPFYAYNDSRQPTEAVYLNGSCYFLAHFFHAKQLRCLHQNNRLIISFDFTKEIFTPIQLPEHHHYQRLYLSSFGDKMALCTVYPNPPPRGEQPCYYDIFKLPPPSADYMDFPDEYEPPCGSYCFENDSCEDYNIWLFKEDKESWENIYSFQTEQQKPGVWSSLSCISDDGNFVLLKTIDDSFEGEKMFKLKLYDLSTNKVMNDLVCCGTGVMSRAYAYEPNLDSMVEKGRQQPPIG